jgi:hypothetical protein
VSAAQMGLGLYGAYQGASRAWDRFQAGEYFGSLLDLVQSGADLYAGWRSCFTGEMLIDWAGGKKRADAVELGDLLWSRDENDPDGELVLKRVLSVMVRTARIWHLRVAGQVLRTTGEHPFWSENRQAWLAVHELRVGDVLRTRDGRLLVVEGVEETGTWERVYNWEVEDYHTYFVSASEDAPSFWAHNTCQEVVNEARALGINGRGGSPGTRNPGSLREFYYSILGANRRQHILNGDVVGGAPRGWHSRQGGVSPPNRRIIGRPTNRRGDGAYHASGIRMVDPATGAWVIKPTGSTFFPDSWSHARILAEMYSAYKNARYVPGTGNTWEGISRSGLRISMYVNLVPGTGVGGIPAAMALDPHTGLPRIRSAFPTWP